MAADNLTLIALLLAIVFFYWDIKHASDSASLVPARWSLPALLIASFLTLFAELAFIRWVAVEVRIFAYVKNLALLVCFLGFGIGCALAKRKPQWMLSAIAILIQVLFIKSEFIRSHLWLESISQWLGAAYDTVIWGSTVQTSPAHFFTAVAVCAFFLILLTLTFLPIGQAVSQQMDLAPTPLKAYSWNLFGSIVGIVAFFLVCRQMLPPVVWFSLIFLCLASLERRWRLSVFILLLAVPCVQSLKEDRQHVFWTPYQQIEATDLVARNGEWMATDLRVNHAGYQRIINLSPGFLGRHPGLVQERIEDNPYNIAYRFAKPNPSVLIVGAGSGNDAAAALRNGSSFVDAVEIDPGIYEIGKRQHPEHPYDSSKVRVTLTDARAFLRHTDRKYDMVMFGLLDSHTQLSDYANMRIDNFVYTKESLQEANAHLSPNGILFVKFAADRPWLAKRIGGLITAAFGKQPLTFVASSTYAAIAYCFVVSNAGQVETALAADPELRSFVQQPGLTADAANLNDVSITTDDWPYLYQRGRFIPRTYYSVALIVIVLAFGFYLSIPEARRQAPSLFFFAMGAGFLLLETQVISRLALFFGTTWQVNGIVIGALLTTLLLANMVAEKWRPANEKVLFAALLGGLLIAYLIPFGSIPAPTAMVGSFAAAIFSIPVFFAGLIFAAAFRRTPSPSASLGANILGAVVGGLLENLSFIFGMRALLIVAAFVYAIALFALWRRGQTSRVAAVA